MFVPRILSLTTSDLVSCTLFCYLITSLFSPNRFLDVLSDHALWLAAAGELLTLGHPAHIDHLVFAAIAVADEVKDKPAQQRGQLLSASLRGLEGRCTEAMAMLQVHVPLCTTIGQVRKVVEALSSIVVGSLGVGGGSSGNKESSAALRAVSDLLENLEGLLLEQNGNCEAVRLSINCAVLRAKILVSLGVLCSRSSSLQCASRKTPIPPPFFPRPPGGNEGCRSSSQCP